MEYPPEITKKLEEIVKKAGMSLDQVTEKFEELLKEDWINSDPQFTENEKSKQDFCAIALWNQYANRPPVKEFDIIPIGCASVNKTKAGKLRSEMYCVDNNFKLRKIVLMDEMTSLLEKVTYFSMYRGIELGTFKDSLDLVADDRARFENPEQIEATKEQILENLKFPKITIKSTAGGNNVSKQDSTGYTISTDWKCIRGMVTAEYGNISEKTGLPWARYQIIDDSVIGEPDKVDPETGRPIPPGMSAWIPETLKGFPKNTVCDFYGIVGYNKEKKEASMRVYSAIKIHGPPMED